MQIYPPLSHRSPRSVVEELFLRALEDEREQYFIQRSPTLRELEDLLGHDRSEGRAAEKLHNELHTIAEKLGNSEISFLIDF